MCVDLAITSPPCTPCYHPYQSPWTMSILRPLINVLLSYYYLYLKCPNTAADLFFESLILECHRSLLEQGWCVVIGNCEGMLWAIVLVSWKQIQILAFDKANVNSSFVQTVSSFCLLVFCSVSIPEGTKLICIAVTPNQTPSSCHQLAPIGPNAEMLRLAYKHFFTTQNPP